MNKIYERLKKKLRPDFLCSDFISRVNQLDFRYFSDEELKEMIAGFHGKNSYSDAELATVHGLMKEAIFRVTGLTLLLTSYSLMWT